MNLAPPRMAESPRFPEGGAARSGARSSGTRITRRVVAPLVAALPIAGSFLIQGWVPSPRGKVLAQGNDELLPPLVNKLIPDQDNAGWMDAGPRQAQGLVYHRLEGSLEEIDTFFRSVAPGLVDYGVDDTTGAIWWWNDALGEAHPSVSANRAPFANGPVEDPSADTLAFIDGNGIEAINRDLVSIAIAGGFDDPISNSCLEAVAALSAYFADLAGMAWDIYPAFADQTPYSFVRWHSDISASSSCPGRAVMNATPDIIALTQDILRQFQDGVSGA